MFQDPAFWVAVAFAIFVAGAVWKGRAPIAGMLDARIDAIRTEINEARKLREQAQSSLAAHQRKLRDAIGEAKDIVARAGDEADRSAKRAAEALTAALARRQAQALDNIAQAEAAARVATEAAARNKALSETIAEAAAEAERRIDAARREAMDNVRGVAVEVSRAMIARMADGAKVGDADIERAVDAAIKG